MCAFCGKIDENFLCEECNKKFERITNVHIQKYKNKTYTEHIYMFKYTDIRREILEYKFDDKAYYYKTISQVFLKNKKICEILKTYDIIIPVPIHNKRRKERGYNQSALIAKEFSKNINELEYEDILTKKKNTIAQSLQHLAFPLRPGGGIPNLGKGVHANDCGSFFQACALTSSMV